MQLTAKKVTLVLLPSMYEVSNTKLTHIRAALGTVDKKERKEIHYRIHVLPTWGTLSQATSNTKKKTETEQSEECVI